MILAKGNSNKAKTSRSMDLVEARQATKKHDFDKVAELWANLAMVQEMKGKPVWTTKQKESGLAWFPYIRELGKEKQNKFIVMEDPEKIFGFVYIELALVGKKVRGIIHELYIEPSHHDLPDAELAKLLRAAIQKLGVEEFNLDIDSFKLSK